MFNEKSIKEKVDELIKLTCRLLDKAKEQQRIIEEQRRIIDKLKKQIK